MNLAEGVVDLRLHTVASDGTSSLEDRITQARTRELKAIAITDHDCIAIELQSRVSSYEHLELISGVEVRAELGGTKVELFRYFINPQDRQIATALKRVREYRRVISRLRDMTELDRSYDHLCETTSDILDRPHIASVLVSEGIVSSVYAAFDRYLGTDGEAFVPMERVPAPTVIKCYGGPVASSRWPILVGYRRT